MVSILNYTPQISLTDCLVCDRKNCKEIFKVDSKSGERKKFTERLLKYGGVHVVDGAVCRNCDRRMDTLERSLTEFREKCQKTAGRMKPHASFIAVGKTETIEGPSQIFPIAESQLPNLAQYMGWMKQLETSVNLTQDLHTAFSVCFTKVSTDNHLQLSYLCNSLITLLNKIYAIAQSYHSSQASATVKEENFSEHNYCAPTPASTEPGDSAFAAELPGFDDDLEAGIDHDIQQPVEVSKTIDQILDWNEKENSVPQPNLGEVKQKLRSILLRTKPASEQPCAATSDAVNESSGTEPKSQEESEGIQDTDKLNAGETKPKESGPCNHILVQDVAEKGQEGYKINYKCITCGKQFESLSLFKHIITNPNDPKADTSMTKQNVITDNKGSSILVVPKKGQKRGKYKPRVNKPSKLKRKVSERPKGEYECDTCGKKFNLKAILQRHKVIHSDERPYKCDTCGLAFKRKDLMTDHQKVTHLRQTTQYCDICGNMFSSMKTLKRHKLAVHSDVRPYPCDVCGKAFVFKGHLDIHKLQHSTDKPFMCETCGKAFKYPVSFRLHMANHSEKKPHVCEVCGKGFVQQHTLKVHRTIHTVERPYACETCGKTFRLEEMLKRHQNTHNKASTSGKSGPGTGKKTVPRAKVIYKCGVCEKIYLKASRLKRHMVSHSDERPFKCSVCDKTFKLLEDRKRHLAIHTGLKPHICGFCGKAFRMQKLLLKHQMVHTGERPYVCGTCGKAFRQLFALKQHQNLHSGAKPYTCETCGKAFSQASSLRSHRKGHMPKY